METPYPADFDMHIIFLRNILDTVIAPRVQEILEMGAFEEEDFSAVKQLAPSLEPKQLAPGAPPPPSRCTY